jgi:hypothetical protein
MKINQKAIACLTCMEQPVMKVKTLGVQKQFRTGRVFEIIDQNKRQV